MNIKIAGQLMPKQPSTFKCTVNDLDDGATTTRTADGTLHRERIAIKRKLEMTWSGMDWATLSNMLTLVSGMEFEVYYPDTVTGQYETKTFYVGNRTSDVAIIRNGEPFWKTLSMNFIEV